MGGRAMKIEVVPIPTMTIQEFADREGLTMEVKERGSDRISNATPWFATLKGVDVIDGIMLGAAWGNGNTPDQAIADCVRNISEQRLVFGAYTDSRREIQAPRFLPYTPEEEAPK
jgi:hypothetical protein